MRDSAKGRPRPPAVVLDLRPVQETRLRAPGLATRFAFDRLDVARMEIYVEVDNGASNAVAASAGFVREGVLRSQSTVAGRRRDGAEIWRSTRALPEARGGALAQRPIPTCWDRCSSFPSVCNEGATMTSAFWNSFMSPYPQVARLVRRAPNRFNRPSF
jgi:hypothetical protein